jgi:hypothetical protein
VVFPGALHFEGFAALDAREFTGDGDTRATVRRGDFADAVFGFLVVKENPFEDARELVWIECGHGRVIQVV